MVWVHYWVRHLEFPCIFVPEAEKVGNTSMSKITTEATAEFNAVSYWMPLSLNELLDSGHVMRFNSDRTRIFEVDE